MVVVRIWNSKLVKMCLDYVWICHSNSFTKGEKLLSLDCNRHPFYAFIKTFRELKVGNLCLEGKVNWVEEKIAAHFVGCLVYTTGISKLITLISAYHSTSRGTLSHSDKKRCFQSIYVYRGLGVEEEIPPSIMRQFLKPNTVCRL